MSKLVCFDKVFFKNMLQKNIKLADLIHTNYLLLPIINRFGIKLGFGDKSVEEVCKNQNINVDFFLEIVNAFLYKNYFPDKHLQSFTLSEIIDYLKKTHEYFIKYKLVQLEELIEKLVINCNKQNKEKFILVEKFYKEYKKEFIEHISNEDSIIYPYVIEIEKVFSNKSFTEKFKKYYSEFSIKKYETEHSDVEEKLFDLKNLIIKYLPPSSDNNLSNLILYELFELEKDLNDHQQIEDKVLIPKVIAIEESLKQSGII